MYERKIESKKDRKEKLQGIEIIILQFYTCNSSWKIVSSSMNSKCRGDASSLGKRKEVENVYKKEGIEWYSIIRNKSTWKEKKNHHIWSNTKNEVVKTKLKLGRINSINTQNVDVSTKEI